MMMKHKLIKNIRIVDDGKEFISDVYIKGERIEQIASNISLSTTLAFDEINGEELVLIPGMIDAHVHFREPGLTYKGNMSSESAAAIAGGVTSIMDMPNTAPSVLSVDVLEQKYEIASNSSLANYSFFMGLSKDNIEEALKVSTEDVCGLTDDGLYFDETHPTLCNSLEYLEKIFSASEHLIALHSENDYIIKRNYDSARNKFKEFIPPHYHSIIRSSEACYTSTKEIVDLAKKYNTRFHLLHVSTGAEAELFQNTAPMRSKRLTAETTIHHLFFNTDDYELLGNLIKWNPSVKSVADNKKLLQALKDNRIDIVATDHAPHTIGEKIGLYDTVKPGGPMVQHALLALLEFYSRGELSLVDVVKKSSNGVADLYRIKERGYIREGYFADLVLVDLNKKYRVTEENIKYKCSWSPFLDYTFHASINSVFVNGQIAFNDDVVIANQCGKRLKFEKIR
jgi:dihydroorotase